MQIQNDLLNIIRRPAVMVYHADADDTLQQRLTLDLVRPVRIHYDEQTLGICHQQGLLPGDKGAFVFRLLLQLGD